MKYLVFVALFLCACAKTQPQAVAPKPKPASTLAGEEWCDKVYGQLLELGLQSQQDLFAGMSHKDTLIALDQHYRETGATQHFMASCRTSMTTEQAECSFQARSFAELKLCNTP